MSGATPAIAAKRSRGWLWLNVAPLLVTVTAWLTLEGALRHDCLTIQARHGPNGSACMQPPPLAADDFLLDWSEGERRELLFAAIADRTWLWPLATTADVRRGAAQFLIESARASDVEPLVTAVADGAVDPAFGALHFALAWSEQHAALPAFLAEWLTGAPEQQLFAAIALAMLTGQRDAGLAKHEFDPLPPAGTTATLAAARDEVASALFGLPLADAAAQWSAEFAALTQRPRGEIVLLLATCKRTWTFEWF